jgi:hypothetical protein
MSPLQIDNELFLNYEKNLLRPWEEKEYLRISFKGGNTQLYYCHHRFHYGKYTLQDPQKLLCETTLAEIETVESLPKS